jgi:exonuclease III
LANRVEQVENRVTETDDKEEISILNIYAPNTGAPIYIKKILMALRAQTDANTVIVGELNTPLSPINRASRQKINKETSELLCTIDQIDMVDIYRVFHLTTTQYTFFSAAHGTFSKTDHILRHTASLNKVKKIEITLSIIRPQWNKTRPQQQKKPQKIFKHMKQNNTLLKNQ